MSVQYLLPNGSIVTDNETSKELMLPNGDVYNEQEQAGGTTHFGQSSGTLVLNTTSGARYIVKGNGSCILQINTADGARLIAAGNSSNTLVINTSGAAVKIVAGNSNNLLQINSSEAATAKKAAQSSNTLQINNTNSASRIRTVQNSSSLVINSLTGAAKIAVASLLDSLQILTTASAINTGDTGQVFTGESNSQLQINSILTSILQKQTTISSTLQILDSLNGNLRGAGLTSANLQINNLSTVSKLTGIAALLNLKIEQVSTGTKVVFPQFNTTLRINNNLDNLIKQVKAETANSLQINSSCLSQRLRTVDISTQCQITTSATLRAVWQGQIINIPITIISIISTDSITEDHIIIYFDTKINPTQLFDVVVNPGDVFDFDFEG